MPELTAEELAAAAATDSEKIAAAAEAAAKQKEDDAARATAAAEAEKNKGKTPEEIAAAAETARKAYEARKSPERKQLEEITAELEKYKRRDEEARLAALSSEQKLEEERDAAVNVAATLKRQIEQARIGAEFKLPRTLWDRIQGSDDAAMRADAEELAKHMARAKVGSATDVVKEGQSQGQTFTRSQIADRAFFVANEKAIMEAYSAGRITQG